MHLKFIFMKSMLSPKQSQPEVPQPCYHRSGKKCGQPLPVCKLLRTENLSTLITASSTGRFNTVWLHV